MPYTKYSKFQPEEMIFMRFYSVFARFGRQRSLNFQHYILNGSALGLEWIVPSSAKNFNP